MDAETTVSAYVSAPKERHAARLRYLFPLAAFAALMLTFGWALNGNRNPSEIPSALIAQPIPQFALPAVKGPALALSSSDLGAEVSLVNVFASCCLARPEVPPVILQ